MANISFLLNQFPSGGVERVTMNLIPRLSANGHRVFIFVHELNQQHLSHINLNVEYIFIPYEPWRNENGEVVENAVRKHCIDLFFVPIISPDYVFSLKERGVCKVCYVSHGSPFYEVKEIAYEIHQRWQLPKRSLRRLMWLIYDTLRLKIGLCKKDIAARYKKRHDELDAYGVLYEKYAEIIAHKIGVSDADSKFFALPNPIPQVSDIKLSTSRKKQIIFVGRLTYVDKRVDRLLKVWQKIYKRFPEWELLIIGSGPEETALKQYVAENKLSRVEFIKFTPTPELYYKESEILCLTSDFEGFGMVLLEAQQYGCATMAFDCSYGVRDILSPNWDNGVFVPNGNINAYAKALSKLMEDEELRRKIQKNGFDNVKRFSIENSVESYETLIQKLCSKK
ncbi:MAG: glycosyltransferase [Bacteroidaceae bacterium]|nr:glycosyltransferase [Bacteroidaceae bacterium]